MARTTGTHQSNLPSQRNNQEYYEVEEKLQKLQPKYPDVVDTNLSYKGARSSANLHYKGVMVGDQKRTQVRVFVSNDIKKQMAPE